MLILDVVQTEASWIIGSIRSILWLIAKGCLLFLDGMFSIINEVWRFKFFENDYVNTLFGGAIIFACSWIVLKVMLEFIVNHMVKNEDQASPISVFKGIILAIFVMFLIGPIFNFGHQFSVALTDSIIKFTNISESSNIESSISRAVIESMANNETMEKDDLDYFIDNWKSVDYNQTYHSGLLEKEVYIYDFNLFMMIVISILILFLLVFIGIQMAKRVVELALYKIIGPVVATGLTNQKSRAFSTWFKGALALFLVTAIQFICLGLMINVFSSASEQSNNVLTSLILLVGGLLFVISSPSIVSSLLGEQIGAMSVFNDIQSSIMMAAGAGMGINVAKAGVMAGLAKRSNVMNLVPKVSGSIGGIVDQFKNMRSEGSSRLGAMTKVGVNQLASPLKNRFDSKLSQFQDIHNASRTKTSSRTISKSPISFNERNDGK